MKIEAPSGMVVDLRGLTARDGRYLSNEALVRDNEVEDHILRNCCPTLLDPGPYPFQGAIDWDRVLVGDGVYLFLAVRDATFPGDPHEIKLTCPQKFCREKFVWQIDIHEFLQKKVKPLSAADAEAIKAGTPIRVQVPNVAPTFLFSPRTRGDLKQFFAYEKQQKSWSAKKKEQINQVVDNLTFWRLGIEGLDIKKPRARQDFLEDLGFREIHALREALDVHDCGVDTSIDVACPHCEHEWEIQLPFDRSFFLPTRKKPETPKEEKENTETAA